MLPIVYTPTVGDACLDWGTLLPRPTGLYLSARTHTGRVKQLLSAWPSSKVGMVNHQGFRECSEKRELPPAGKGLQVIVVIVKGRPPKHLVHQLKAAH